MPSSGRKIENRTLTLLRGLRSSGLCVIYHDSELAIRLIENLPPSWPDLETVVALGDQAIFDPFTAERVLAAKREVLETGTSQRIEVPFRREGQEPCWFSLNIERDSTEDGTVRGLFVSVTDVTEARRREAALRDLLYEVSHRSRNLLAILQSILRQTADNSTSVAEFEEKFRGRIASLARSQDLLTFANWEGVRFRRLAMSQIEPFADDGGAAPSIEGSDPLLSPNSALHLGLALHELAANSASFGVLRNGAGTIRITARPLGSGSRIEWLEMPDHPVAPVAAWGFGRTVLRHVVPRAIGSEAEFEVRPDAIRYAIDIPDCIDTAPEALPERV
jgi:two-component sensor histidine kinase